MRCGNRQSGRPATRLAIYTKWVHQCPDVICSPRPPDSWSGEEGGETKPTFAISDLLLVKLESIII